MNDYVIFTDSASDISEDMLKKWDVKHINLKFRFEGEEKDYSNYDMPSAEFYNKMRNGAVAKTWAVNMEEFKLAFEEILKEGKDILCLAFSSGLSTTYNSARIAAEELKEKYSQNKITVIDTLAASAGEGLIVNLAVKKKNEGAGLDENAEYIKSILLNLCHWFSVDDLVYLKRGGRISPAVAFVGGVLGIKPVLHVDNEGHLINISKVRGRKAALNALADKFGELAKDKTDNNIFISHADCMNDALYLKNVIFEKFGASVSLITDIGPVIGAHSGPGTIALFFIGKNR